MKLVDKPLPERESTALSDPQRTDESPMDEQVPIAPPPMLDLDALQELDHTNPDLLQPTLAALIEAHAERFDLVRFRFIQVLTQKALQQRPSVALAIAKRALQALSDYLDAYLAARDRAASLVAQVSSETSEAAEIGRLFHAGDFIGVDRLATQIGERENKKQGLLAALTQDMVQRAASGEFTLQPSFEDEFQKQELEIMQSITGVTADSSSELTAMRCFRESLVQRNSQRRVARAIQDGPENPGPLNSQALIIRSLSMMRDLSPSYTSRFVSYMDTLLWLHQAAQAIMPAKSKGPGRRKS